MAEDLRFGLVVLGEVVANAQLRAEADVAAKDSMVRLWDLVRASGDAEMREAFQVFAADLMVFLDAKRAQVGLLQAIVREQADRLGAQDG